MSKGRISKDSKYVARFLEHNNIPKEYITLCETCGYFYDIRHCDSICVWGLLPNDDSLDKIYSHNLECFKNSQLFEDFKVSYIWSYSKMSKVTITGEEYL